jgi:trimeric autotransporter adhesin
MKKAMMVPAWALALGMCAAPALGQMITTAAGTPWIFPAASLPALSAPLGQVQNLAIDGAGNIYVADLDSSMVMQVSPSGVATVVAGNGLAGFSGDGGPGVYASLDGPQAIALDTSGNLYIADTFNNRIRKLAPNGTITTVAGTGAQGYSGDGIPAASASLYLPTGVATDLAGNLYIADYGNNRIRKVTTGGIITTVAGNGAAGYAGDGGPATSASLSNPSNAVLDANGNLYIADFNNNRVRKVSANGTITTVAGNGQPAYSGDGGLATAASLSGPVAVALDGAGNLYIADNFNNRVRKVTAAGVIGTVAGNGASGFSGDGGPATAAVLDEPDGVVVDAAGNLYLADQLNERIRKVSAAGTITTFAGNGRYSYSGDGGQATSASFFYTADVTVDSSSNLYVVDFGNNRIRKVAENGIISTVAGDGIAGFSGDGGSATSAAINGPYGVAVDSTGNLYVADTYNHRIRKVSTTGMITTFAGNGSGPGNGDGSYSGDGGQATAAGLNFPYAVALDAGGNLYIADWFNNRVRKVTPAGVITTFAGNGVPGFSGDGGAATKASIDGPTGVATDSAGNLYIADSGNQRIRKVTPAGTITTVAGNGIAGFSGDGGLATSASLHLDALNSNSTSIPSPSNLALDTAGNLYISDYDNIRVRKVSVYGTITTIAGSGSVGAAGDGGLATAAQFNTPTGVALDGAGNVYIADFFNSRVREILATPASFRISPASLSFTATSGGTAPASQTVTLASAVAGIAFTASASASWLSVSPSSGSLPLPLAVSVDPSSLSAGTYSGTITISAPNAASGPNTIGVTVTVSASKPASLGVSTQNIGFTATQGASATTQALQILNNGGGSLPFTVTISAGGGSWLSLSAQSGTATPATPASLTVTATPGSLSPGTYNGAIAVTGVGSTVTVPVTLSISPPSGTMLISQSALTFNAVSQGGTPLPQVFGILNTGQGSMNWTASATTLSGGNWLQISSGSGTVAQPFLDVSPVNASVSPSGLAAGTYYGQIQIASAAAVNSPQLLTVILTVLPPGTNLGPQIYPNGLIFTGVAGVDPSSQDVTVANTASTSNSYLSGAIGPLSILPVNAVIQPTQPTTLHVYPNFSSLGAGTAQGTITLQFSDGSPSQAINVLMSVAAAGAGASVATGDEREKLEPRATSCSSQALQVVFQLPQPSLSFTATVGQSMTLEVKISDGCGNLVAPGPQQPQVTAFFSTGEPQASMTYIGNGVWQATWRPVNAAASAKAGVTAAILVGGNVVLGEATVQGSVIQPAPAASTPLVTQQGVVHAASDVGGAPIAPGELITVYGANLASGSAGNLSLPFPPSSNGTQVLLGTTPLPILYTSSGQMNVQVPYSVPVNTNFQLSVQNGTTLSVPQTLTVAQAQPGIFTTNEQGTGQGAIEQSDGVTLAQPGTPAAIGEVVVIYCTGLGTVTPAVTEGQPAPKATTVNPTTVTIGGQPAQVQYSGLTPGFAGLYQVNAVVPSGITTGDAVPVTITVAGQTSQPGVTMSVH